MAFYDVNRRVLAALGLGHLHVRSAVIHLDAREFPTVEVEIELTGRDGKPLTGDGELVTELRRYDLVERVEDRQRS